MALLTIKQKFGRLIMGQNSRNCEFGYFTFSTTDLTGSLPCNMRRIDFSDIVALGAPTGESAVKDEPLATFSATYTKYLYAPFTGVISTAGIIAPAVTSGSTSDSNNYTFGITNVTQTLTPVDSTVAANSNKATGGSALAADTLFAFTLGNAANCAVNAGDLLKFVATKTGTYTVTEPTLKLTYTSNGLTLEIARLTDAADSEGAIKVPSTGKLAVARYSNNPVSGAKYQYLLIGE